MSFKLIFAALTATCMFYFIIATRTKALQRLFVLAFFSGGLVFITWPELSNQLAHLVGIGRGVDLILYLSTLFLYFICFNFGIRFRSSDERLTLVVRELALRSPVQREPPTA